MAVAMESNPELMNKYLLKLGVSDKWHMVDVMGLEGEALTWVPKPVLAVILLFPMSDTYEQHRLEEETALISKEKKAPKDVFHLRQVLSNVCGTVALVHSVANNTQHIELADGLLKSYLEGCVGLDAAAKGALLENTRALFDAYEDIENVVEENKATANNHFVTFIHKDGTLFELDGRKTVPIDHGPTTAETFLENAAKICKKFIGRDPNNIGFNVVALVPAAE